MVTIYTIRPHCISDSLRFQWWTLTWWPSTFRYQIECFSSLIHVISNERKRIPYSLRFLSWVRFSLQLNRFVFANIYFPFLKAWSTRVWSCEIPLGRNLSKKKAIEEKMLNSMNKLKKRGLSCGSKPHYTLRWSWRIENVRKQDGNFLYIYAGLRIGWNIEGTCWGILIVLLILIIRNDTVHYWRNNYYYYRNQYDSNSW